MKYLFLLSLFTLGCSAAPEGFCDCLEKGQKLNDVAHKILEGDNSEETRLKMKELKAKQTEACSPFQNASGADMMNWQAECENN